MKNLMKRELINDIVTGLLVAATFAAVMPADAFAQLSSSVNTAQSSIAAPTVKVVSYISYILGTVGVVKGVSDIKKHTENPGNNPLGKGIGSLGAGAAFLAAPSVIGMLENTGSSTAAGSASFNQIPGF